MYASVIWIPPSLCGCQLRIAANWADDSINDGKSYRHPIPQTIKSVEIVNVCDQHIVKSQSMTVDQNEFFSMDNFTGEMVQRRGYLKYPIEHPTPAECLYTYLSKHGGQTHRLDCGCQAHQFVDHEELHTRLRFNSETGESKEVENPLKIRYLPHPHHTKKCHRHTHDTHDMQQARIDHEANKDLSPKEKSSGIMPPDDEDGGEYEIDKGSYMQAVRKAAKDGDYKLNEDGTVTLGNIKVALKKKSVKEVAG